MPTSTSDMGPQMYEFAATSSSEMKQWMALITEVSNKNKVNYLNSLTVAIQMTARRLTT